MKITAWAILVVASIILVGVLAFFAGVLYGQAQNTHGVTRQFEVRVDLATDSQTPLGKTTERALETLYKNEKLRANLTDDEAKIVLDWAARWIEAQIANAPDAATADQVAQDSLNRVRPVISTINTMAAQPDDWRLTETIATLEPAMNLRPGIPRTKMLKILTTLTSTAWSVESE